MKVKAQSWNDIRNRYLELPEDSGMRRDMLRLVEHISQSVVAETLWPWTSMFELRITQSREHPFQNDVPYLSILPLNNGSIEFRHVDTNITDKQWSRIVGAEYSLERFDKFINQLHWVVKVT